MTTKSVEVEKLAMSPKEAARAIGISERTLWSLTADRTSGIPFLKIGTRTVYPVRELQEWLGSRAGKGIR